MTRPREKRWRFVLDVILSGGIVLYVDHKMTGLPKRQRFSGCSLGALQAPVGNVYSRPGHKCELLRDVVSNPLCARDSFQYQNFRLYRLAAVKRLPKKSHIDISTRPSGTIRSVGVAALSRHHVSSPRR